MIYFCILACLLVSGCSISSWYPLVGSVGGAASGAAIGGPVGGGVGAGLGYAGGKTAQLMDENKDLSATVTALTTGDVEGLIENQMGEHQGAFDSFVSTIKRILIIAACLLGAYLSIPIFVARKTAESCSKKHITRPPFPTNEKS